MRASASIDQIDGDLCDPIWVDKSSKLDGESRTERTIGMRPMGGLVRMMEEKAKHLILEPFEKKMN